MSYIFQAILEDDPDGGYLVTFPDVPEAITIGKDYKDALLSASEGLGLALRGYIADGKALPKAKQHDGGVTVPADAWSALKLAVIEAFKDSGITKTELARRLGKQEAEARRILDPDHSTKVQQLQQSLAALGKQVFIDVKDTTPQWGAGLSLMPS